MNEQINVTLEDYRYALSTFYGHWICFPVMFFLIMGLYYCGYKYNYLIAEWANSDQQ